MNEVCQLFSYSYISNKVVMFPVEVLYIIGFIYLIFSMIIKNILFIYSPEREKRASSCGGRGRGTGQQAEGETGSPLSKKPDVGLSPRRLRP